MQLTKARIGAAVVAIAIFVALFFWWRNRPDAAVARVKEIQQAMFTAPAKDREEQKRKMDEFRTEMDKLTPEQKKGVGSGMRQMFETRLKTYAAASVEERQKILDEDIERVENMRKQWQAASKDKGPAPGSGKGKGSPGGPGGFGNWGGKGGTRSKEDIERRKKEGLDNSTPESRAARDLYFQDMQNRRKQRGLPAFGPPGGRF